MSRKKIVVGALVTLCVASLIAFAAIYEARDEASFKARFRAEKIRRGEDPDKAPPTPTKPEWEWLHVSAEQLVADYRANEVAADSKYKGAHLAVAGTVGRVTGEFLTLEVANGISDVQCIYSIGADGPENVQRGEPATIYGMGSGKIHNVIVTNCRAQ
jgi:hypothetical protein